MRFWNLSSLCQAILLSALLLTGTAIGAQETAKPPADMASRLTAIEKAIEKRREDLHIPGIALVIVKDDKPIYIKGLGLRDVARKLPVTPRTQFAIGSSSKAFTAMTVLMSADEKKLALNDSPKKYLSYFKLRDPEADSKITIGDLLCHRSGLDRTDIAWATGKLRSEEIIRVAGIAKPTAKFGEKFQYQNVMYLAAGEIAGAVQRSSWENTVRQRIFKPLGMKASNTSVRTMQRAEDYALGYDYDAVKKEPVHRPMRDLTGIAPAGAINSNVEEMAQWVRLMLGGGVFEGKRLVSEQNFAEMTKERIRIGGNVGYGYGWFLRDWNGHKVVEHGGNIDGFNAQVALMPDQKLGFVLLTNVSASPLGTNAMQIIWENLVGAPPKPAPTDTKPSVATGPEVAPEKEAGVYVFAPAKLKFEVAYADGKLKMTVPSQPTYPLERLTGRRYKLASPAPDGFFATFRPKKEDANISELYLEQPQGNIVLTRDSASAFTAPISVDELMKKVLEAAGGETNLRRVRTMQQKYVVDFENEGLTGDILLTYRAPNASTTTLTLRALNKPIATQRSYFDGVEGGDEVSFASGGPKTGPALADAALEADFYQLLYWKTLFKTVTITKMDKVGEEEVYVVEKKPEQGSVLTDYISTKSFRLLKRDIPGGVTDTYSDFRTVNGVTFPYKWERAHPSMGRTLVTLTDVKFNLPVADSVFAPAKKK